jgi:hypothetical protein
MEENLNHILAGMFADRRFRPSGWCKYWAEINGRKIGVVLATKSPQYDDCALNKAGFDRLLAAKREGRIDVAVVVAARVNGRLSPPEFIAAIDADELAEKLNNVPLPRRRQNAKMAARRPAERRFPSALGIINTPTLRRDGTLLSESGYDSKTGLWYKPPLNFTLPPMPELPTRAEAESRRRRMETRLSDPWRHRDPVDSRRRRDPPPWQG